MRPSLDPHSSATTLEDHPIALLQSFDGSSVKEILTSLVATTSTDMPKSSNIENMKLFSIFLFGHKPRKNEILSQQKAKGHPIISILP